MNTVLLYKNTCGDLHQSELSSHTLATYVALRSLANPYNTTTIVSIESIGYQLKGTMELDKREVANFKSGLQELHDNGNIEILSVKGKNYEIDMSNLIEQTGKQDKSNKYIMFKLEDIRNLYNHKTCTVDVFKYLFFLLGEMDKFYIVCSREVLSECSRLNIKTVDSYNDILEECNILYVHRYNAKYVNTGKKLTNLIGFMENKEKIIEIAQEYMTKTKGVVGFDTNGNVINTEEQTVKRLFDTRSTMNEQSDKDDPFGVKTNKIGKREPMKTIPTDKERELDEYFANQAVVVNTRRTSNNPF